MTLADKLNGKLRWLIVPFLLIDVAFVSLYSLFDWLFVAKTGWLPLDDELVGIWLPMVLGALLVGFVLSPRMKILALNKPNKRGDLPFLFLVIATGLVMAPAAIAASYIRLATGQITHVANSEMLEIVPETKYYSVDRLCIDKMQAIGAPVFGTEGRNNETFTMDFFALLPLCVDKPAAKRKVWIGLEFHDSMSNSASNAERETEYNAFLHRLDKSLLSPNTQSYKYLESVGFNSDRRGFVKVLQEHGASISSLPNAILIPHKDAFAERTGNRLGWMLGSLAGGMVLWAVMIGFSPVRERKLRDARNIIRKSRESGALVLGVFFLPQRENYGLPFLLDANIFVYIGMVLSGLGVASFHNDDLIAWGANYGPLIHGWGVLRLISSQFVHGGLMHIASNMYGLFFAALFLMPVANNARLIACYLVCGLGGSIASVLMHPTTIGMGASGAIMGLFGVAVALVLLRDPRLSEARGFILTNIAIFAGLTLFFGFVMPGIDNTAHIGGFITGLVLGGCIRLWDILRNQELATGPNEQTPSNR